MEAIYARVSTEDQARHGYSLAGQLAACRERLREMGAGEAREYVDDGYSGEFIERPALERLRADLRAGLIGAVVIYDPDRMSRNLTVQLVVADEIERAGAKLLFVTGDYDASPEGRLFFAMKGAVAAYEKAKIRERTLRGKRQKAAQGKIVFNARPFGYGWDAARSQYVVDEAQATVVRLIYALFLERGLGTRLIARELKVRGVVGPKGRPLSAATVHKVLAREMYCGTHHLFRQRVRKVGHRRREVTGVDREEWVAVAVPAIVTRELWERAQRRLRDNRRTAGRNCRHEYLLRGVARCALCGRGLVATTRPQPRKGGAAKEYSYYTCVTHESATYGPEARCPGMRIPAAALDAAVWGVLQAAAEGETALEALPARDGEEEAARLAAYRERLRQRQGQIARLIREGLLDAAAAEGELRAAKAEVAAADARLAALRRNEAAAGRPGAAGAAALLAAAPFTARREMVLQAGYVVYAARREKEAVEFYLQ